MNGFKIEANELDDNYVYTASQKVITQIVKDQDEATYKAILRYCVENNVVPNIISEDKLKLILRLGIAEYSKRNLESQE